MKTLNLLAVCVLSLYPVSVFAVNMEDAQCQGSEVTVCFADGECICKVRQIELSDPTPQIVECVDQNDSGICNN